MKNNRPGYERYLEKFIDSKDYYHSTTEENANSILKSKRLKPDREGFVHLAKSADAAWDARKFINQTEILKVSGDFKLKKLDYFTNEDVKNLKRENYDGIIWGNKEWIVLWNHNKIKNITYYRHIEKERND